MAWPTHIVITRQRILDSTTGETVKPPPEGEAGSDLKALVDQAYQARNLLKRSAACILRTFLIVSVFMRGDDQEQSGMFSYVSLEERVPPDHSAGMAKDFDSLYAKTGRPSVRPERPLREVRLQMFYTVRSGRLLAEQRHYNLFRCSYTSAAWIFGSRPRFERGRGHQEQPRHLGQSAQLRLVPATGLFHPPEGFHESYQVSQRKRSLIGEQRFSTR